MDINPIAAVATIIATGVLVIIILSGKKPEEFLYSNKYSGFSQYFFRPKSLILSLSYGFIASISAYSALKLSPLAGYEHLLSVALFFFITFILLMYNCYPGSANRKLFILFISAFVATTFFVYLLNAGDLDLANNLSTVISSSLTSGCLLAVWIESD